MGEPELVAACSCEECQRRTGSIVSVNSYWQRYKVATSGAAKRYSRKGHSGGDVAFYFCPACGSTVYWDLIGERHEWMGIAAGLFSDPDFPSPAWSEWERTKYSWLSIPAKHHFDIQP
jgi:hypothetical protein